MKITQKWLEEKNACSDGTAWWLKNKEGNAEKLAKKLIKAEQYEWGNWLLPKVFTTTQNIKYAIFAAEQVIEIYEKQYPKDDIPRKAIEAAKAYIDNPNDTTANVAYAAFAAARAAAYAAADAADAAFAAARAAANAADSADSAAKTKMQIKILNYGLTLLKGGKE
jgi:hypothetical protein